MSNGLLKKTHPHNDNNYHQIMRGQKLEKKNPANDGIFLCTNNNIFLRSHQTPGLSPYKHTSASSLLSPSFQAWSMNPYK